MTSSKFTEPVPELNKVHDTLTETISLHCTLKICLSDIGGGKGRNNTPSPSSNIGKQSCLEYEAGFMENDTNLETKIISNQRNSWKCWILAPKVTAVKHIENVFLRQHLSCNWQKYPFLHLEKISPNMVYQD